MCEEFRKLLSTCWPGIFGALISLYYTRPLSFTKGAVSFLGGAIVAISLAPALTAHTCEHVVSGVSFLLGTFSMSLIGIVFQIFDRVKRHPIRTFSEFFGVVIDILLAFRHGRTRKDEDDGN